MPKVCFVCPDLESPAGGVKQLFRQVMTLRKHGVEAYIVHSNKNFRIQWFEHDVPALYDPILVPYNKPKRLLRRMYQSIGKKSSQRAVQLRPLELNPEDIIVLPEFWGWRLNDMYRNQRTVIYNQNCYYTFRGYPVTNRTQQESIYFQDRLEAILVASEDAQNYLGSFSTKPVHRVFYGMDHAVFSFSDQKKKQLAYMPRKLNQDAVQVLNILSLKGALEDWEIVGIKGMNESQVAQVLQESSVFLSFNHREGFGMPPAEAMSCGAIVVGYQGQGGAEYLREPYAFPVAQRNIRQYVETLEHVLQKFEQQPQKMAQMGKKAAQFIQDNYSMNIEEESIMAAWNKIL